ncbi:MAG: hypothetical protein C0393_07495 [Anaerolinea sp.]|nr:hypothetical protein [Anaerolinea sp.]
MTPLNMPGWRAQSIHLAMVMPPNGSYKRCWSTDKISRRSLSPLFGSQSKIYCIMDLLCPLSLLSGQSLLEENMAEMKTFSQQDPAWKNTLLGLDKESTIGSYGCLLTSMTMVASVYGFDETPAALNDKMKSVAGFQNAYVIPRMLPSALPGLVYRNYIVCSNQPAPLAEIDATLAAGKPVIIEVDYSPKAGLQNHWIVLYAKRGDDYLIRDPYPFPPESKEVTLASRYGFAGSPAQVIQAALWLDGPAGAIPTPPPKPPQLDTGVYASFKVYATTEDLAIRSQTLVSNATCSSASR